jgi:hypothetical protein
LNGSLRGENPERRDIDIRGGYDARIGKRLSTGSAISRMTRHTKTPSARLAASIVLLN